MKGCYLQLTFLMSCHPLSGSLSILAVLEAVVRPYRAINLPPISQARLGHDKLKTESTRKLSNFNSQWTKILYQNKLKNTAFFFIIETVNCLTEQGDNVFLPTNWQIMSIYSVG